MRSIIHRHQTSSQAVRFAAVIALAAAASACTDSPLDEEISGAESRVRFDVTTASGWNALSPVSRSAVSTAPTVAELTDSATTTLYLIGSPAPGFSDDSASRAAATDDSSIADFSVYATLSSGADFMNNARVTRAAGWLPDEEYLWPGEGSLHFNAFSPFTSAPGENGITALPAGDGSGAMTLDFRTPATVLEQPDLMWATPVDADASPCNLTFNHALTAVTFMAGAELPPCTVETITLSGILSEGTLDIETGQWSSLTAPVSFTASPGAVLDAAEGSVYATPSAAITAPDETFMLIPQTLGDDAAITVDLIMPDGTPKTLTASIAGSEWVAGTTMRYRISSSPESDRLVLEAVDADGKPVSAFNSPYNGTTIAYSVNSYYATTGADGSETRQPVEWDATLIDDGGNTLSTLPAWIRSYRAEGSDTAACTLVTRLPAPLFLEINDHTKALRQAADINQSSGYNPYNLASSTGAPGVDNTANCYIINAPGHYSIPLVYGNAVKDGAANEGAYTSTLSSTTANKRKALMKFVNHLGNEITDPYIYNNASCTPAGATLLWEERLSTVTDVALSSDGRSLTFVIPADFIRQGNAVVAVTDARGDIMWSWHLWLTDYQAGTGLHPFEAGGISGSLYPLNMGRIYGGDKTEFSAGHAVMRLTQKNVPAGMEPLSIDITIDQAESTITTLDCYSFYQWGRKDPMIAGVEHYYDSTGRIMDGAAMPAVPFGASHLEMIETSILNPGKFITATESDLRRISPYYCNLWDINHIVKSPQQMQEENVKTIYDPCPAGAKVPVGNEFRYLAANDTYTTDGHNLSFTAPDGSTVAFTMYGYREITGKDVLSSAIGAYWTAISGGPTAAQEFVVSGSKVGIQSNDAIFGFGIRPVTE